MIDINTAEHDALAKLPGMSSELADAVLVHREQRGFFLTVSELAAVDGIDEALAERIAGAGAYVRSTVRLGFCPDRNRMLARAGQAR